jgi:hypothetical protein
MSWIPTASVLTAKRPKAPEIVTVGTFELDHIDTARVIGGDEPENLALCCKSCNIRKGHHTVTLAV